MTTIINDNNPMVRLVFNFSAPYHIMTNATTAAAKKPAINTLVTKKEGNPVPARTGSPENSRDSNTTNHCILSILDIYALTLERKL